VKLRIYVRGTEDDQVQGTMEVDSVTVLGAQSILVTRQGQRSPAFRVSNKQYLEMEGAAPGIIVGNVKQTCTFLVTMEGANFAKACGEEAVEGNRCGEHRGK
jgi:hypothetical protein